MYRNLGCEIWKKVLGDGDPSQFPKICWEDNLADPKEVRISMICQYRRNGSKFFFDMIGRWLAPESQVDIRVNFSTRYLVDAVSYSVSEVILALKSDESLAQAKQNFPFLEKEILMGVHSPYHAKKILEMKGTDLDDKTGFIQETIRGLVSRFPLFFDYDIFSEMQRFIVVSKEVFKAERKPSQMARIIFVLYRFRKRIREKMGSIPQKRHLQVKLKKTFLHTPFGVKEVISVYLGMNFLRKHECFEERHLIAALSQLVGEVEAVPDSYYSVGGDEEEIQTIYLEIQKGNQKPFSNLEFLHLQKELTQKIGGKVEQLVSPIFMPRNEEEVMRNILTLSNQLKYLKDVPQMMISFDEQLGSDLSFTVILVRIMQDQTEPLRDLLDKSAFRKHYSIDRVKVVGRLRRKHPKEASVLRIRMPSQDFLREDYSVDLFHARRFLLEQIERVFGEVRDFNGGMIAKQTENFDALKKLLGTKGEKYSLFLQNFFHGIFPATLSSTTDPGLLKVLFELFLKVMETKEGGAVNSKVRKNLLFTVMRFSNFSKKQKIYSKIEKLKLPSNEVLTAQVQVSDSFYIGSIYLNPDKKKQKFFLENLSSET